MFIRIVFICYVFVIQAYTVCSLVLGKVTTENDLSDNFPFWFTTTENNPLDNSWLHQPPSTDDDKLYFTFPMDNYNAEDSSIEKRFEATPTVSVEKEQTNDPKNIINKEEKLIIIKKMSGGNKKPKVKIFKVINKHCGEKKKPETKEVGSSTVVAAQNDSAMTSATTNNIEISSKVETTTLRTETTTPVGSISPPETTTTPMSVTDETNKQTTDSALSSTTDINNKIVIGTHLNNFLKEFTLKKAEKIASTTESDNNISMEWPFTSEEFEAKLKRYNGKSKSAKRAIGDTGNKNSILDNVAGYKKPKFIEKLENESSLERTERLNNSLQKLIQFITIAGQVDSYLTGRVRSVVSKLAAVYTDDTIDTKTRNKRNLFN